MYTATSSLTLPGGVPSHDTFRRVFCLLDPLAFQGCFFGWMTALMQRRGLTPITSDRPELRPIALAGKTARGSARRTVGQSPLHLVSAWSVENHLTLGQVATDAKSNEITAIPELLQLLDPEGAVVTIDVMGCQKEIATGIVGEGGEYALAVKENQPHLFEDVRRAFDEALEQGEPGVDFTECQTEEVRSGRQETRTCCGITNPRGIRDLGLWTKLTAICMGVSQRVVHGVAEAEIRSDIGSVAGTAEEYYEGCVVLGGSKTRCTGCWTSVSVRTTNGTGPATARRTWRGSASWRCVCSRRRRPAKGSVSTVAGCLRVGRTTT